MTIEYNTPEDISSHKNYSQNYGKYLADIEEDVVKQNIIQHFKPIDEESSSREREREDEARVVVDDRDRVDFRGGIERVHGVQKEEGRIKGEKSEETHVRKKVVTEEGRY